MNQLERYHKLRTEVIKALGGKCSKCGSLKNLELDGIAYKPDRCPVAEKIQPQIMQFKTNYRNMDVAKRKTEILNKLINSLK